MRVGVVEPQRPPQELVDLVVVETALFMLVEMFRLQELREQMVWEVVAVVEA
jgi:hypothetical protein